MRKLIIWLAIATFTFIFGLIATTGWIIYHSRETSILKEPPVEDEPLTEVPKTPIPLCELGKTPAIYENHFIRVSVILFADTGIANDSTLCPEGKNVVRIEYESAKARAEIKQLLSTIDNKMNHCWLGVGTMDGKLELIKEDHLNEISYRFIVTKLEKPQFVTSCAQTQHQ